MLSVSSLLNPAPPGPSNGHRFPPSPASSSSPTDSCGEDSMLIDRPVMPKCKMPKDAAVFTKSKPKGDINFRPYEHLDEVSLRLAYRFQIYPLGKIQEYSRHIPYNSGKKDFFEKTGRESFEVFQYIFKVPDDDTEYAVMWDYNVGLVRMTPFFKCCKYPKTTPAKMLNSNPGLKEITHSITGGSIMAQGYWMPYQCAKAVCATFCHNIAGALIPIFGPDFPSLCTPAEAPEYSRMVIDPAIVIQSTRQAEYYRRLYSNAANMGSAPRAENGHVGAKRDRRVFRSVYDDHNGHHPRYRIRKTYTTTPASENSSYSTDTDGEVSPSGAECGVLVRDHHFARFPHSPLPPAIAPLRASIVNTNNSGWTPVNAPNPAAHIRSFTEYHHAGPSPWLSAVPRFATTTHMPPSHLPTPPKPGRLQHYPHPHPQPQPPSHPQSYPPPHQTHPYHHPSTIQRQLPPPSDPPPPYSSQHGLYQSPRTRRPAENNTTPVHPTNGLVVAPYQNRISPPHTHQMNKENRTEAPSHVREDNKPNAAAANVGVDKKAALLLMNLSVRDNMFWKKTDGPTTLRKNEDRGRDRAGVVTMKTGRAGLSSPGLMFSRMGRVRSNSM